MKRSGFWFWVILILLVVVVYTGAQAVRGESVCNKGVPKTWQWAPPQWKCPNPR